MRIFLLLILSFPLACLAQESILELNDHWQFRSQATRNRWYNAQVPGTIHTDLLHNKLIPDPFFGENEKTLQWIDKEHWEYKKVFSVSPVLYGRKNIELVFDGLDTYADVYLNGKLILRADNMFRQWVINIKPFTRQEHNILNIHFYPALSKVDSLAKANLPLVIPDHNRVYARKAPFQFGWDWGPKFIGCGIWQKLRLRAWNEKKSDPAINISTGIKLIRQKDSIGTSFYFEKNGKPVYIKGANWIPANIFLPSVKPADYKRLLRMVKSANMNMIRVWGGGVYEADLFYDLCDKMGIMVWQDFMFAGGMSPGDDAYFANVREEVKYQVGRLKRHPCIVLWCGNNEIKEAWQHWGWQKEFNLHGVDSSKVWNDYERLFEDSIPRWINEVDGNRPYISSSPAYGWGNPESYTSGDSHYWGLWWGMQDWESFEKKTGRFVSEYGMQAMPDYSTIKKYTNPTDRHYNTTVIKAHQKATDGFNKLHHYINRYFFDSTKLGRLTLLEYTYLTQCLQYYILYNSIAIHRSKQPWNMGTMLWQLNDCWPVTSWSIIDFYKQPKAGWYAVKRAYSDEVKPTRDSLYPKDLLLQKPTFELSAEGTNSFSIKSNVDAKYVYLYRNASYLEISDNYIDLRAGQPVTIKVNNLPFNQTILNGIKILSLFDVLTK